jgi:glycosyltransferase involved in cell wall biosynthesis
MKGKTLVYIDQLVGPNSIDIINALCHHFEIHLYYGSAIVTYAPIDSRVKRHRRNTYSKDSSLRRLLSWAQFYITTLPVVLVRRKDHVFLVSNPPLNFFFGYVLKILTRTKFSLLMWDIYPDIIVQSGIILRTNPITRIWSAMNSIALRKASKIFTVSDYLADEIAKYERGSAANICVVPTWTDAEKIKPIKKSENPFIQQHQLEGKFVVMYSGNMGKTHDLETLIDAAGLMSTDCNVVFVLIGDGEKRQKIESMVNHYKLKNVLMLPFQESDVFPYSIASADIGVVTLASGFENYSVPSKTYYLMAAGAIIFAITKGHSELERIVSGFECGFRFDPGDAKAMASKIIDLKEDSLALERISLNARKGALQFTIRNATNIANEVASA